MAISTSALSTYVNENKEPIIKDVIYGAPSVKLMTVMSDVKGDAALNLLGTSVVFGDGKTCGWDDDSTTSLSQRKLETASLKVNIGYCQRALTKYWAGQELNIKIGLEEMPFEEKFTSDAVSNVSEKVDKLIWFGSKANTNEFDGLCTIAHANSTGATPAINVVTAQTTATTWDRLALVVEAIPAKDYEKDIVVMSVTNFRKAVKDYEAANPYKSLDFTDADKLCFIYPNSNVKVYGVIGMEKSNDKTIMAYRPDRAFYGCDYEDAVESFNFRYDEHDEQFEYHQLLNAGTQFAYLDEVVLCE